MIKTLQKSVCDMQTSIVKLVQTADLLNLNMQTLNTNRSSSLSIEQIKQELQGLKGLFLGRIQVPSKIPSWQSNMSDVCVNSGKKHILFFHFYRTLKPIKQLLIVITMVLLLYQNTIREVMMKIYHQMIINFYISFK